MCEAKIAFGDQVKTFIHISPYQINKIQNWIKNKKLDKVRAFIAKLIDRGQYVTTNKTVY